MQPVVHNVLVRLWIADDHLVLRRVGHGAGGEEARNGVAGAGDDLVDLVHVLPAGGEDDGGAARRAERGKDAAIAAKLLGQRRACELVLVLVLVLNLVVPSWQDVLLLLRIVQNELAPVKFLALRAQVEHAQVVLPRVRVLFGVQDDKVPLAVPAPLLRRARHVLPRVGL